MQVWVAEADQILNVIQKFKMEYLEQKNRRVFLNGLPTLSIVFGVRYMKDNVYALL